MRSERGFSLLAVLLAVVALGVLGVSVARLSATEAGAAQARAMRAQALAAAESGLAQFERIARPSRIGEEWYLGGGEEWLALPDVPGPDGTTLEARYRVRGDGAGPLVRTGRAVIEGQVLLDGRVVGTAQLLTVVGIEQGGSEANTNQEDAGPTGGSADVPDYVGRPTSLTNL